MKDINQIKEELTNFGRKYRACKGGIDAIKGNNLKELFENISIYIKWCKETPKKKKEFNNIFNNELVIDDGILLCNCTNLTSIIIPDSVTLIGGDAFYGCIELTSIIISNSITSIENYTFSGCKGLTSVTIPESVKSIGDFAFYECNNLTSITIPNSVTLIGDFAFCCCWELTSIEIPYSVSSIGHGAFYGCRGDLKTIRK